MPHTSAAFSATLRVHLDNRPGAFARMAGAIGEAGGSLDAIDLVRLEEGKKVRDVTVLAIDEAHIARITEAVGREDGIDVEQVSDRTLLLHRGGKLEIASRVPLKTRDDLSMAYTPGVARVCRAIADEPEQRLEPDDQEQQRRDRHRRHRGTRARRHRARRRPCP